MNDVIVDASFLAMSLNNLRIVRENLDERIEKMKSEIKIIEDFSATGNLSKEQIKLSKQAIIYYNNCMRYYEFQERILQSIADAYKERDLEVSKTI